MLPQSSTIPVSLSSTSQFKLSHFVVYSSHSGAVLLLTTDSSLLNPVRALTHSVSRVEQFALAKAVILRLLA